MACVAAVHDCEPGVDTDRDLVRVPASVPDVVGVLVFTFRFAVGVVCIEYVGVGTGASVSVSVGVAVQFST